MSGDRGQCECGNSLRTGNQWLAETEGKGREREKQRVRNETKREGERNRKRERKRENEKGNKRRGRELAGEKFREMKRNNMKKG